MDNNLYNMLDKMQEDAGNEIKEIVENAKSTQSTEKKPKTSKKAEPKKETAKLGRPKKKEQDKSKKLPHTVYFEPETEKQMEEYMQNKRIKKSDLIEIALIEYMKNNP